MQIEPSCPPVTEKFPNIYEKNTTTTTINDHPEQKQFIYSGKMNVSNNSFILKKKQKTKHQQPQLKENNIFMFAPICLLFKYIT